MSKRTMVAAIVVVIAVAFFISGLRYVPGTEYAFSAPICGPLTDNQGNKIGDAGPCPSLSAGPPRWEGSGWEWVPFWVNGR